MATEIKEVRDYRNANPCNSNWAVKSSTWNWKDVGLATNNLRDKKVVIIDYQ